MVTYDYMIAFQVFFLKAPFDTIIFSLVLL